MYILANIKRIVGFPIILALTAIANLNFPLFLDKVYSQDKMEKEIIELSVEDITEIALKNSLDIQIAQFDAYIKRTSLEKAESLFDTFLNAKASFQRDKKMQSSTIFGEEEKGHTYSVGIEKKLPTGTTVSLDATGKKVRTDSPFASLNPYNEALTEISVTQSLGKNFFGLIDRSEIKITKIDIQNSDFTSLDNIENTIYAVQKSYWNLALKDAQLSIAKDMLESAKKLYKIYKDKYGRGLVEESELLAMEALVSIRQSEALIAELEKETAKNDLLFLINKGESKQKIKPKDILFCSTYSVNLYDELKEAIEQRRDYKRIKNELEKNKIDIVAKKNALWPQIDLEASFARNNIDSERRGSWGNIGERSNDDIFFRIKFKVPLENRQAKAELEKTNLGKKKLLLQLKRIEQKILQELNNKVNQVNTVGNQVKLFESTVKIHQNKLNKQIERLNYGRSDADTLIRYEEDLLEARLSLASYLFQYRVNLIELALAKNSLLDQYWKEPL